MGASSVPRLRLQEGQTAKPPGAVRKRTSQRPCGHPWLPVRARRRREEEGRQKKESRKRRQRFSEPPWRGTRTTATDTLCPDRENMQSKGAIFRRLSFRFEVTLSPSPSRSSSHLGGSHCVSSGVHPDSSRRLVSCSRSFSRRLLVGGGAWLVASPSQIWAPESLSPGSPQEDHTERKSLAKKSIIGIISMDGARSLGRQGFSTTNAFPTTRYSFPVHSPEWAGEPLSPEI